MTSTVQGSPITMGAGHKLNVPDNPIVPFIEGDGTGRDIWRATRARPRRGGGEGLRRQAEDRLARGLRRREGVQADQQLAARTRRSRPSATYLVGIKGPLTTPIGGGIRSLNVALRQMLDLYVCLRPVRWFQGVPSPVKHPRQVDMVIFRENTEDIYAGIEFEAGSDGREEGPRLHREGVPEGLQEDPLPGDRPGIGIKPVSREAAPSGSCARRSSTRSTQQAEERHVRPQGQHHEVHRGRLHELGLRPRRARSSAARSTPGTRGRRRRPRRARRRPTRSRRLRSRQGKILVKDAIADITLQQVLTRPKEFDVIATLNLNGDYLSRRARGAGRRHRHRARRQHQLRHRPRHLRGDPRHRAEVRRPRQGQPRLASILSRRDDAPPHGLERGGRPRHQGDGRRHRAASGSPTTSRG